jgi:hypothetical protein
MFPLAGPAAHQVPFATLESACQPPARQRRQAQGQPGSSRCRKAGRDFTGGGFRPTAANGTIGVRDQATGDSNIEEFIERRWLTVNPGPAHYPY